MKRIILPLALAAPLLCPIASANTGQAYIGGQLNYHTVDFSSADAKPLSVAVQLGYQFSDFVGAEIRAGSGVNEDSIGEADIKVKNHYGAYLNAGIPLSDWVRVYALAGITSAKLTMKIPNQSSSSSDSDFSYGAGISLNANEQTKVSLEYLQMVDKGGIELSGFNLGITYHF
ncbi:porin family protein [Ferrimonas pelagia]|uniref:Outer membrane protein beta-barrel domain-containing protein n=1 Tax=Ferrimonas pelagia TaxID=1177826 RepID=A0ABP9F050_9GAMM